MRELDLVLSRYLEQRYDTADADERAVFQRLLDCPDTDLLYFLTGRQTPPDAELERLVETLRALSSSGA